MSKLDKKYFSKIGFLLLIYSFLHVVIGNAIGFCVQKFLPNVAGTTLFSNLVIFLPAYLIAFPISYFLFKKFIPTSKLEEKKIKFGDWIIGLMISYGLGLSINIFINIVFLFIQLIFPQYKDPFMLIDNLSNLNPVVLVVFVGIVGPMVEEIIFRKILCTRLLPYGEKTAIFFSALIFGVFHGNFHQCFFAFALGIIFAFVYVRTGKIKYTMFMHMAVNLTSCVFMLLSTKIMQSGVYDNPEVMANPESILINYPDIIAPMMFLFILLGIIFGVALAGVVLFFVFLKRFKLKNNAVYPFPKGTFTKTVLFNPGMICLFLFWIIIFGLNTFGF